MPSLKRRNGNCDPRDVKRWILISNEKDLKKARHPRGGGGRGGRKMLKKPKSEFRKLMELPGEDHYFGIFVGEYKHRTS